MKEETMRKVLRVKDKLSLCNNKSNLKPREKLSPSFIYSAGVMLYSDQVVRRSHENSAKLHFQANLTNYLANQSYKGKLK